MFGGMAGSRSYIDQRWGTRPLWPGWDSLDGLSGRGQVDALALRFGRNLYPALLFDWWHSGTLTVDDLRAVLPDAWCWPEWPQRALGVGEWVGLFRTAGFVSDTGRVAPTEPVTVHRGTTWGRRRGMAWTTDRQRAEWFADRWTLWATGSGMVVTATIDPGAMLAFIDDRRGSEVVLDPGALPPIRKGDASRSPGLVTLRAPPERASRVRRDVRVDDARYEKPSLTDGCRSRRPQDLGLRH